MRAIPVLLILALAFAGCAAKTTGNGGTTNKTTNTTSNMTGPAVAVAVAVSDTPPVPPGVPPQTMSITPNHLDLKVGQKVNLTITNNGRSAHNFNIDDLNVKSDSIPAGGSLSIEFLPTKAGTYKMYCSLGTGPASHDAQGMHGDVVVS